MPCDIALLSRQARPLADPLSMEESRGVEPRRSPVHPFSRRRRPRAGILSFSAEARELESHTHDSKVRTAFQAGPAPRRFRFHKENKGRGDWI